MEIPPETAYFLGVVKTILRLLGQTNRDLERHLGLSGSYMSRLFSGDMELRFQHLLDISRTLGLTPQELVTLAYPELLDPPAGEAALRYWAVLEPFKSPAEALGQVVPEGPSPTLVQAVEEVVSALLQRMNRLAPPGEPSPELPAAGLAAAAVPAPAASRPRRGKNKKRSGRGGKKRAKPAR